jgi:hypothetical protein
MTDNVIILGAGASVDAGIPVLADFVDKMQYFALTGKNGNEALSDEDKIIFNEAMKVRDELNSYHGRASFDDHNTEDILSILSFNMIEAEESGRAKLDWMTKAIAKTIELTCNVTYGENLEYGLEGNRSIYQEFWRLLFYRFKDNEKSFPSIISFNYDLVLERGLFQLLAGREYHKHTVFQNANLFPFDGITINFKYKGLNDIAYGVKYYGIDFDGKPNDNLTPNYYRTKLENAIRRI